MPEQNAPMKDRRKARERVRDERALREKAWRLGCSPELLRAWMRDRDKGADRPAASRG